MDSRLQLRQQALDLLLNQPTNDPGMQLDYSRINEVLSRIDSELAAEADVRMVKNK